MHWEGKACEESIAGRVDVLAESAAKGIWKERKITVPSPVYYHMQLKEGLVWENGVYDSDEAFFEDVAAAYRKEFQVLYEAGVRNLRVDDVLLR
jgi:methionine synthase II (cobalamin-independent)